MRGIENPKEFWKIELSIAFCPYGHNDFANVKINGMPSSDAPGILPWERPH